jgi:hypothetical protein
MCKIQFPQKLKPELQQLIKSSLCFEESVICLSNPNIFSDEDDATSDNFPGR